MVELTLPAGSRPNPNGRVHKAASGAVSVRTFRIYRFDPDSGENPRIDTFEVDIKACGPMVLDALIHIKAKIDSSVTFRRSWPPTAGSSTAATRPPASGWTS